MTASTDTASTTRTVAAHYDGSAPTYHEQYDEGQLMEQADYPANVFRLRLVTRVLQEVGAHSVYELGAGEATPLIRLQQDLGLRIAASDLSPGMVRAGRENLQQHGLDPDLLVELDAQDRAAVEAEQARLGTFDAVLALGVIPHVQDDSAFVGAMTGFCRPGGTLLLQFRNSMFSMFTFNRLTKEFILDDLLVDVPDSFRDAVADDLDRRLAVDLPPRREWDRDAPAYDDILARFHNPFELADVVRSHGFADIRFHWYNYHPTYPMLASRFDSMEYRRAQMALEGDPSWRGMFLCSSGVIEARRT